jgi:hypothetical protein
MTSLSSFPTSTTFWAGAKSGGGTILDVFFHPRRFVFWELSDLSVLSGSPSGSVTWTDCFHSVSSSWMSSLNRISKTRHTTSSWSSSTSGNVTVFTQFPCGMCTSHLVRQVDRGEGLLCQLEIVFLTLELLGTEFLEEAPHKIFGPFGRDQPTILNRTRSHQHGVSVTPNIGSVWTNRSSFSSDFGSVCLAKAEVRSPYITRPSPNLSSFK